MTSTAGAFSTLTVELTDGIGRLTLNQPDQLNPLGSNTLAEIAHAARWFDDEGARVVVITSAGDRAFSAGFDLREISGPSNDPPDVDLGYRMVDAVENMEAITIASIHGHCVGGGILLAVGCDLRIAADNTRFAIPEVDLGIPLAWGGIPRLVREVGPAVARELVMTCRPFDAVEAQSLGMVNRVVPLDRLRIETDELAASLAAKPVSLLRTTKRQVQEATEDMVSTQSGWTASAHLAVALADPEARAAASAYLAGRGGR